jgi:uncharacterized membrane protein|tara:strand:+ start:239 stop:751 length:513 start_codon:yes stop_codon:yes gene_type:complete
MLYQAAVFIHLVSAVTWVGGSLFLVLVLVPVMRTGVESPSQGARLLGHIARRFRTVAWASIILLVGTGLFVATDHWRVTPSDFFGGSGWFIDVLRAKVGLVFAIIVLSFFHDFVLGPRVTRRLEDLRGSGAPPAQILTARRTLVWIARANLLMILTVVALAVTLGRGSPL